MTTSVLVVDDEKTIADTLAIILRQAGYTSNAVYDAPSALVWLESNRADVVVSDVVMPSMDGIQMAIEIASKYPNIDVLLFSGQAATADLVEGARSRGYEFEVIAKPVHPKELLERIANLRKTSATA